MSDIDLNNIYVTCGSTGDPKEQKQLEDIVITKQYFTNLKQAVFATENISNGKPSEAFVPTESGACIYFQPLSSCMQRPNFILEKDWENIEKTACAFVNSNKNIMPKMLFPTDGLIYNSLSYDGENNPKEEGFNPSKSVFDWKILISHVYNKDFNNDDIKTTANFGESIKARELDVTYIGMDSAIDFKDSTSVRDRDFVLKNSEIDLDDIKYQSDFYGNDVDINGLKIDPKILGTGGDVEVDPKPSAFAFVLDQSGKLSKKDKAEAVIQIGELKLSVQDDKSLSVRLDSKTTESGMIKTINSQKPIHATAKELKDASTFVVYPGWNGVFISDSISDDKKMDTANFYDYKTDINYNEFIFPDFDQWVAYQKNLGQPFEKNIKVVNEVNGKNVNLPWGEELKLSFKKHSGKFAYMPIFFCPVVKFSIYFKGPQEQEKSDGTFSATFEHFAYPIYAKNNSVYTTFNVSKAIKVNDSVTTSEDVTAWYRFDFEFSVFKLSGDGGDGGGEEVEQGKYYPRIGFEMFGYIFKRKTITYVNNIENKNGFFDVAGRSSLDKKNLTDADIPIGEGMVPLDLKHPHWINYAKSISLNYGLDSCSGNITLDAYAMFPNKSSIVQSIGGITLNINGGNQNVIKTGNKILFSGIAMELKEDYSPSSNTIDVSLYGFDKKLSDIKLINTPFWDGDLATTALDYLCNYAGVEYVKTYMDVNSRLPRSSNYMKPAVNINQGTSVREAIGIICDFINHKFVVQPDGKLYVYACNHVSIPYVCYKSPRVINTNYEKYMDLTTDTKADLSIALTPSIYSLSTGDAHELNYLNIIGISVQPDFSNVYNTVFTSALRQTNQNTDIRDEIGLVNVKFTNIPKKDQYPYMPWSKIVALTNSGFMSNEHLNKIHNRNIQLARGYVAQGGIQIPGNDNIWIFDRVFYKKDMIEQEFYVYGVSHYIDFTTKEFSTNLQICEAFDVNPVEPE